MRKHPELWVRVPLGAVTLNPNLRGLRGGKRGYTVKNGVLQYAFFGASATLAVVHPIGCNDTPQNSVPLHPSNTPV